MARRGGRIARRNGGAAVIRLLVDEPLRLFLPTRDRGGEVDVGHDGTASLGHVVQSAGVPLTEVGLLMAGGTPVEPSYRPRDGDVVRVGAGRRPQPLPSAGGRFVLDVHLGSLARRLRLLGVDASYSTEADDSELVARSLAEGRVLLTKDQGLLRRRSLWHAAYVRGSEGDEQLADVLDRFAPTLAPYTRCGTCNGLLRPVSKAEVAGELEPGTVRSYDEFARCAACGRVYWRGAHARRLDSVVSAALRPHAVELGRDLPVRIDP